MLSALAVHSRTPSSIARFWTAERWAVYTAGLNSRTSLTLYEEASAAERMQSSEPTAGAQAASERLARETRLPEASVVLYSWRRNTIPPYMIPQPASRGRGSIVVLRKVQAGDWSGAVPHGRARVQSLAVIYCREPTSTSGFMVQSLNTNPHFWSALVWGAAMLFPARSRWTRSHFSSQIFPPPHTQSTTPATEQFSRYEQKCGSASTLE